MVRVGFSEFLEHWLLVSLFRVVLFHVSFELAHVQDVVADGVNGSEQSVGGLNLSDEIFREHSGDIIFYNS